MPKVIIKADARDVRVDRIGYAEDLIDYWAAPMKAALKQRMSAEKFSVVESDRYFGKLSRPTSSTIDAAQFFKLYRDGDITEADFLSCLRISKEAAGEFLSDREIEAMSKQGAAAEPRLTISRRKGIDLPLATIIQGIVEAAAAA